MSNFLTDNPDLLFTLKNLDLREVVSLFEKDCFRHLCGNHQNGISGV